MCYMDGQEQDIKLTAKQEKFCQEYLVDLNATQSAIRAGYSADTAYSIGWENLRKPEIQLRLTELRAELNNQNGGLAQQVIDELKKVGFSNIQDMLESGNEIKDITMLDRDKAAVISSIKKSKTTFGDGEGNEGQKETIEFKLWDKLNALEKLGKHLGIFEADNKQKKAVITVTVTDGDDD